MYSKHHHKRKKRKRNQCQLRIDLQQDYKRTYDLDHRNQHILRPMMQKLTDIEQVTCNSRKQMSHLLIIIKRKCQLLIMTKNITSHIRFHPGPHHMSQECYIIIAAILDQHQNHQENPQPQNRTICFIRAEIYNITCNVSHDERNCERYHGPYYRKKQITEQQKFVRSIVG